ncbi:retrovirus-related pol polyprotein from transposon TNT 1-94 [Tanacetum coccineum]
MAQIQEVTLDAADNSELIFDTEPLQKVQNNDDNYNVFANDREHPVQPESVNDTYLEEQGDTNITIDSLDMSTNGETYDQDDDDLAKERDFLASLIDKLKCEINGSKNCNKLLESSNKALVDKLKDLKKFQAKLDRYHDVNYASKMEIDCAKAKGDLITREPNRNVNQSVATSHKKIVATESTVKKPRSIIRKLYEPVSKTCSWWYPKFTPSGYKWKPKSPIGNVNANVSMPLGNASRTAIILEPMTPKCSKHMTGNLKLLTNFVEKFLGTVKFRNDQIAPILGYADLGNDLLIIHCGTDLYSITLQDTSTSPNPICLMAKATSSQAWLWHRKAKQKVFSHKDYLCPKNGYNFYNKTYVVHAGPKNKTHEVLNDFLTLVPRGLHAPVRTVQTDKGTTFLNKTLHEYFAKEGIRHETSTARTPKQNGITKRRNRTLVEVARTILSVAKVPLYFWAEAIAITCFTQNCSLVIPRHEKMPYHIINGKNRLLSSFTSLALFATSSELVKILKKIKEKGKSLQDHVSSDPIPQCQTTELEHDSLSPGPQSQENVPQAAETVTKSNELDLLFSMMFDELINGTTPVVSKSSIYFNNRSGYQQKDRKPSQNDKTEHGMEKTVQNQGQSPKNDKVRVNTEESAVKPEPELKNTIECNLYPSDGPGKPTYIINEDCEDQMGPHQLSTAHLCSIAKDWKTLKARVLPQVAANPQPLYTTIPLHNLIGLEKAQ